MLAESGMSIDQCREVIAAGMATMVVHVESRITAAVGEAFYTIGPGGEELMACAGVLLRDTDATALHYRHLATQVARALAMAYAPQVRAGGHVPLPVTPVAVLRGRYGQ